MRNESNHLNKALNFVIIVVATASAVIFGYCVATYDGKARAAQQLELKFLEDRSRAQNFLDELIYVKDPRTGACFALYRVRTASLDRDFAAAVPCDGIPTNMLIVFDVGTNTNTIAK